MTTDDHVYRRPENGIFEYRRRVPGTVAHLDGRKVIKASLGTRDQAAAIAKGREHDRALEELWSALLDGERSDDAWSRYRSAIAVARARGFSYRPIRSFGEKDIAEVVRRVLAAHSSIGSEQVVSAVLGAVQEPQPKLSELWTRYSDHNKEAFEGMSPNQLRKHRVPRERAVTYAVGVIGDKPLGEIAREDTLALRDWWVRKIAEDGLKADTANRCFTDIKGMLSVVDGALQTSYAAVWAGLRVKATNRTKAAKRPPYPLDFIQDRLLRPGALDGLNLEARVAVYIIIETGARPSEICNLRQGDIILDAEVPHVAIRERFDRRLKTSYSARTIPLVGCALWAAKQLPGGFARYADREDTLSNTVNKYLLETGLRPTKQHVLYSLRHTFQDRILAAGAPDRLQTDLMGHEFDRPVYGEGASLAQKRELLDEIKFRWEVST